MVYLIMVKKIFSLIFLVCLSVFFSARAEDPLKFPYRYTPEKLDKKWMEIRVEGQPKSYLQNPLRFVGYSIKAFKKKFSAPKELLSHFKEQEKVWDIHAKNLNIKDTYELVSLQLLGDIMWLREDWSNFMGEKLLSHMESKDLVFANLETLISKSHKVPTFLPARATFNSPPSIIDEFKRDDGRNIFSALSVANNHSLDYGELGFRETLKVLEDRGIPFSGALLPEFVSTKKRWVKLQKKGLTVGFYAATYGMNNQWERESKINFNLLRKFAPHNDSVKIDLHEIDNVLKEMKKEDVDLKIISLHWGFEYEYYPEPRQMIIARDIVGLGADIIMGHHSHSQQPMEICFVNSKEKAIFEKDELETLNPCLIKTEGNERKALIVYGLGNFLTNMYGFLSEVGTVLDLNMRKAKEGSWEFLQPSVRLIYNERDYGPEKTRRTVFIEEYLEDHCFDKECDSEDLKQLEFVKNLYPKSILSR